MGNIFKAQITCGCDALVHRCLDFVGGRWIYVCQLEENLKTLEMSVGEVESIRDDMLTNINIAEMQGKKRLKQVHLWLSRVDDKIKEINKLLEIREPQIAKLCLGCCSTNFSSSYKFGKEVHGILKEVNNLIKQAKEFKEVAVVTLPEPMIVLPLEATIGLESSLQRIISYLVDKDVSIVGIFGEGGIGKSTILKGVNNVICQNETSSFDIVILVEISKESMKESIQNHIGKKVGFSGEEWISKSLNDKAIDISDVLKRKKFVLLLDDVFESLNLTEIGVPLGKTDMVSKVVFTTPLQRICMQMRAQRIVKVEPLGPEDSWRLFSDRIGEDILNANSEISDLAKELVAECGGVPKILIKWAHNMAFKSTAQDWTEALKSLRMSIPGINLPEIIEISKATEEGEDKEMEEVEDGESATTSTSGTRSEDINVFERLIKGEILKRKLEFAGRRITVPDIDGEFRKAVEYACGLKMKYENATIGIFSNGGTGITLKFSEACDVFGHLTEKPMEVENGQWGIFLHMPRITHGGMSNHNSCGSIEYSAENAHGVKFHWLMAWENFTDLRYPGAPGRFKVYTRLCSESNFCRATKPPIYQHLLRGGQESHDRLANCESRMYVVHGLIFAVLGKV